MDEKSSETAPPDAALAGLTPDMKVGAREKPAEPEKAVVAPKRRPAPVSALAGVAALVGLASLAATAWLHTEMRREILRVSTDMAQLRLSLDLYAQRDTPVAASGAVAGQGDGAALAALENRIAIIEQNWRGNGAAGAAAQPTALPPLSGPTVSAESDGDCLPSGTRLLVASGDSYPVCGTGVSVDVMNVSNGYISLTDGTTVPSGSSVPLNGTSCTIAVTSAGDEAVTGYAEIRVSC